VVDERVMRWKRTIREKKNRTIPTATWEAKVEQGH